MISKFQTNLENIIFYFFYSGFTGAIFRPPWSEPAPGQCLGHYYGHCVRMANWLFESLYRSRYYTRAHWLCKLWGDRSVAKLVVFSKINHLSLLISLYSINVSMKTLNWVGIKPVITIDLNKCQQRSGNVQKSGFKSKM